MRAKKAKPSKCAKAELSGRKLARGRYHAVDIGDMVVEAFKRISNFCRDARLSKDQARKALQLALDEVEDEMASETVSWVDDVAVRWPPAGKGRNEEME